MGQLRVSPRTRGGSKEGGPNVGGENKRTLLAGPALAGRLPSCSRDVLLTPQSAALCPLSQVTPSPTPFVARAPLKKRRDQPLLALDALPGELPDPLLPTVLVVLEVHSCVDVRRRVEVRVNKHGDNADQDAVHTQDRPPALVCGLLLVEAVCARRVQDGDADFSIRVDVGVPHLRLEPHLRRIVREVWWELEEGAEDAALIEAVRRALEHDAPLEEVRVILEANGETAALVLADLDELPLQELPRHVRHGLCATARGQPRENPS
eukprot:CAMPEP_0113818764 /NCGR_PEP_ID=MMETSP0328-20130328/403_1 /TAXON_ID=39455 /ORGANISM="Alexandrium minutum" /LENGTH=264 /DNA_ID=CAMNT_0000786699 /DNA_START=100 /DNA_END=892 /DNA_ORIENTATION=+ /assembly_acc=CAM_ASM_000350